MSFNERGRAVNARETIQAVREIAAAKEFEIFEKK